MADTVLSMARSMVGGALSKAASAAADEMSLLMGVRKDIWYACMNFFVQVAHLP
jgi:disease resistance protein RPM1